MPETELSSGLWGSRTPEFFDKTRRVAHFTRRETSIWRTSEVNPLPGLAMDAVRRVHAAACLRHGHVLKHGPGKSWCTK